MRRFSFGDKGTPEDGDQQAPESGEVESQEPQSAAPPGPDSESSAHSGPPQGQEPASDEPAPIHSDQEHDGGSQSEWAPPTQSGSEPATQVESSAGDHAAEEEHGAEDEHSHAGAAAGAAAAGGATAAGAAVAEHEHSGGSRVSVVDEPPTRPAPPAGASEEEYKWHTYKVYPSGRPDAVEFIDTYKAFGRNRILRGLNMGLPEGMVSMILGPSGTGKSVCIKHMVGLLYPDEGDVLVHGESVPNMPDDNLFEMRKKFGLLFQDGALFGSMNIFDNTAFPLRQHTEKGEDEIEHIVMRRLSEVGLGNASDLMPNELSGGMRKRAGFARALVLEPDILLFDEPDSGLDPVRTALLGELILEIHRDMMEDAKKAQKERLPTFAVITHDIMSARRVADYINVLWKGRIVEAGPAEDMLNSENPFIRQFLAGESQGPLTMD